MKVQNLILNNEQYPLLEAENNKGNSGLKITTGDGFMMLGPLNTAHAHIETDRSNFYFNKELRVDSGIIGSYDEDLYLRRATNSAHQITISTSDITNSLSTTINGTLTLNSGSGASYGRVRGYPNDNHFIVIRGSVATGQSALSITGAHRTTFVEHAENNDTTGWYFLSRQTGNYSEIARITRTGGIHLQGNKVWHAGNDGSGSGLDADTLDGINSGSFLRSDASDNYTAGTLSFGNGTTLLINSGSMFNTSDGDVYASMRVIRNAGSSNLDGMYIGYANSNSGHTRLFGGGATTGGIYIRGAGANDIRYANTSTMWHAGNDGSGSGLDADLLDGLNSTDFLRLDTGSATPQNVPASRIKRFYSNDALNTATGSQSSLEVFQDTAGADAFMTFHVSGDYALYFGLDGGTNDLAVGGWSLGANSFKVWHAANDGASSGLDADLLDGLHGSSYWQKQGSWYGDLGSHGYDRVQGVNYTGGEFVLVEKNAQMSTLVDGDYFSYEAGGFFSSSNSTYGNLSGFNAYNTNTIQVIQKDGGNANLRVTGSITRAGNTVWDSGNDGASSGLDADMVDGMHRYNHLGVGEKQTITVNGDTDKYYPVVITGGSEINSEFEIYRGYNEQGPDDWNSASHKGGLTFRYRITGSSGWGGYPTRIHVYEAGEIYSTVLGGIAYTAHTMKHVVWLRGGGTTGARYHIFSPSDFSLEIFDDTSSGYTSGSGWKSYDHSNNSYDTFVDYRTLTQRNAAMEGEVYNNMSVSYNNAQTHTSMSGTGPAKTFWNSSNDGSGSGLDADTLDGIDSGSFLRSDTSDTASGQYSFTKTNDHAIEVGTIRGRVVGSQSGDYIHMYERVHIGSPSGWGSRAAPSYGLSTYGGADLATDTGAVRVITGSIASSNAGTRGLIVDGNYTNGQYRHRWRKQDNGGGVPLYLDRSHGTANSYSTVARFGPYSSNPEELEVYGAMKTNGQIVINQNIASPSNYYNGLQMEVKATSGTAGIGLHRSGHSHVGIYTNTVNRLDFDFNSGDVILNHNAGTLWGSGNDGSGSGLDADTVDGIQGSSIVQTGTNFGGDVSGTYNAIVVANNSHQHSQLYENAGITYGASYLQWLDNNGTGGSGLNGSSPANGFSDWHHHLVMNHANSGGYYSNLQCSFHHDRIHYRRLVNGSLKGAVELFHTGNDGSGSGLDADLLDGQHKAYFEMPVSPLTQNGNMNNVSGPAGHYASVQFYNMYTPSGSGNQSNYNVPEDGGSHYHVQQFNGYSNSYNNWKYQIAHSFYNGRMYHRNQYDTTWQGWATVWDSDSDGSGSGLDADLLDGLHASSFARKDTGTRQDFTGSIKVSTNNATGGGIVLADDGDIVDLNDAYCSMRFSYGVRVYSANSGGAVRHTLHSNGNFTATGNVTAYSDIRLKDNIVEIPNALEKVTELRGVTYNRTDLDDSKKRYAGVIAQEVEQVLPEVVDTDDQGIKNVAYGNMVGLLIEAVKELKQEVDDLKAQLKEK